MRFALWIQFYGNRSTVSVHAYCICGSLYSAHAMGHKNAKTIALAAERIKELGERSVPGTSAFELDSFYNMNPCVCSRAQRTGYTTEYEP